MSNNGIDLIGLETYQVDNIVIKIPKVKMIRNSADKEAEKLFWQEIGLFTKTPQDMMSELDSLNIDFEEISDYRLFLMLYVSSRLGEQRDYLFENIDFFNLTLNDNKLVDKNGDVVIDEEIYNELSSVICSMIVHEKPQKITFGNAYAKKMRIKQDYKKKQRAKEEKNNKSALGGIILRLVCTDGFPYNFTTVNDITVYELLYSLKQIDKNLYVNDLMQSRYYGNDLTNTPAEDLSRYVM